ncbi:GcrA cell cycle regulator [Mesorhizobium sp. M0028]|uniref:GcrA family cell cycle regulator n=1 Tax=Mesorhizobium sp. M0028 TaxID=2956849 RepID=UPI003338B87A
MSTGKRGYTDAEIVTIEQWLKEGLSALKIAAEFSASSGRDVTRNAIIGIVSRNKTLNKIGFAGPKGGRNGGRPRKAGSAPRLPRAPAPYTLPANLFLRSIGDQDREGEAFRHRIPSPRRHVSSVAAPSVGMRFIDCLFDRCRWPIDMSLDAPATKESLCCGALVDALESYCRAHKARQARQAEAA